MIVPGTESSLQKIRETFETSDHSSVDKVMKELAKKKLLDISSRVRGKIELIPEKEQSLSSSGNSSASARTLEYESMFKLVEYDAVQETIIKQSKPVYRNIALFVSTKKPKFRNL